MPYYFNCRSKDGNSNLLFFFFYIFKKSNKRTLNIYFANIQMKKTIMRKLNKLQTKNRLGKFFHRQQSKFFPKFNLVILLDDPCNRMKHEGEHTYLR